MIGRLLTAILRFSQGLLALGLVLLALYVSLGRQFIPLVAEYREALIEQASAQLQMPVSLGALEGQWQGFTPLILLHDVQLGEASGGVRLKTLRLKPDILGSLLARQLRIDSLELEGLRLSLKQDVEGAWQIEGLTLPKTSSTEQPLVWPAEISLADGQISLQALNMSALTLNKIELTLLAGQRLDLRLRLPGGEPLAGRLDAHWNQQDWWLSSGQAYLNLPQADWAKWLPKGLSGEWAVDQAKAGGEFWAKFDKGILTAMVARLNAPAISMKRGKQPSAKITDLRGSLYYQRQGEDVDLRLADFAANLGEQRWGELELALRRRLTAGEEHWQLQADRLELTPLGPLAIALAPLPEKAIAWVQGLHPQGALQNINLDYWPQRSLEARINYSANLDKVAISAFEDVPSIGNIDGTLSGSLLAGQVELAAQDFLLHYPRIFETPWRYRSANARVFWRRDGEVISITSPLIKVDGDEGKVTGDLLVRLSPDPSHEDYMDLRVGIRQGDARFVPRYLPKENPQFSKELASWLKGLVKRGAIEQGFVVFQGALSKKTPPEAKTMAMYFKVADAQLNYQPGWPELGQARGEVRVDELGLVASLQSAQILQSRFNNVQISLPRPQKGKTGLLHIEADYLSSLGDSLKILQEAPLGTQDVFKGWQGQGALQGHMQLDIPMTKAARQQPRVVLDFSSESAQLKIPQPELSLEQIAGSFRYDSQAGLSSRKFTAQALGAQISGSAQAEGRGSQRTRLLAKGNITLKRLLAWGGIRTPLPAQGRIPLQMTLLLDGKNSQLSLASNLHGLAIDLPAPLGKRAEEKRDSQWRMSLDGAERNYWATYADRASLVYAAPQAKPLAGRGELRLGGDAAVLPTKSGVQLRGRLDELDADAWLALLKQYSNGKTQEDAGLLTGVDLQIGRLKGFGQSLDKLHLQLQRLENRWQLGLESPAVVGTVTLPDANSQPMQIQLQRLDLPGSLNEKTSSSADPLSDLDPRTVPALDLQIDQLLLGGKPIGAWKLNLRPEGTGLSVKDMQLELRGLTVAGSLLWQGSGAAMSTHFQGNLSGKNLADVLTAWNFAPSVSSQRFKVEINGNWPGSPAALSLMSFSGTLDSHLRKGQFAEVDGGANALRVFGLLNFNAINRRLRLDFSDLLGKGLSYDHVKGVLVASNGVYQTRGPLTLEGPSSNLELEGWLDMVRDQVDAKLLVAMPITDNLPLAALLVGAAPAVGGALFVVDKLLGNQVARFASVQYSITGSWQKPTISFEKKK